MFENKSCRQIYEEWKDKCDLKPPFKSRKELIEKIDKKAEVKRNGRQKKTNG